MILDAQNTCQQPNTGAASASSGMCIRDNAELCREIMELREQTNGLLEIEHAMSRRLQDLEVRPTKTLPAHVFSPHHFRSALYPMMRITHAVVVVPPPPSSARP